MTFALTPASAFTASVSTISAATANTWRTNISQSLDTVNGGAYANVATIDWSAGSAGWRFYAAVAVKSTGTLTLDAGATVSISADPSLFGTMRVGVGGAGGGVRWYATSTFQVDDTVAMSIAGDATWTGASTQTHASGSSDVYSSGATFTIASGAIASLNLGGASAAGVTFIGANGAAVWNGASTATWQTASVSLWQSGSNFTVSSGTIASATFGGGGTAGTLTVGATGTLVVTAGASVTMSVGGGGTTGSLTINANGTLTTSASSTVVRGGTETRTGSVTLSGNNAWTALRIFTLADPPVDATDARKYDIIECDTLATADDAITFSDPAAGEKVSVVVRFSEACTHDLAVYGASDGLLYTFVHGSGIPIAVQFYWNGTHWRIGLNKL